MLKKGGNSPNTALQLTRDVEQLTEQLIDEQQKANELRTQAEQLEQELAAETEIRTVLEREIARLQAALAEAQQRADGLESELKDKLASRQQEYSQVEVHIQELDKELNENTSSHDSALVPLTNNDVTVQLPATDADFPSVQTVTVTFAWYCTKCDQGGELAYETCPHCHTHAVLHNHSNLFEVPLPSAPCYGKTRRLEGQGNYDAPSAPQGAICVLVIRRS